MFDIHCHILYGSDDGAGSLEEALKMAKLAALNGTHAIIATPHSNVPSLYYNFWDSEQKVRLEKLNSRLTEEGVNLTVFPGNEIFATGDFIRYLNEGRLLTLNNSAYALVEFDFYESAKSVFDKILKLADSGYRPVIAHPERYSFIQADPDSALQLKRAGALLQINKGSIKGSFGRKAYISAR